MRILHVPRMYSSGKRRPRRSRTSRLIAATTALALSMLGVGLAGPPASAATLSVSIKNLQYNPPTLNVNVGDTVVWSNDEPSNTFHSVTGGPLASPDLAPGAQYSFTFTAPGTYAYSCRFHPDMVGQVVVGGGPTTTPPPPPPPSTTTPAPPTSTTAPTSTTGTTGTTAPPPPPGGGGGAQPGNGGGAPVGVGPLPVSFHLTDNQGSWFDTNLSLFGTRSLAVAEMPRVNLGSLLPSINSTGLPLPSGGLPALSASGLPALPGALPALPGGLLGSRSIPLVGGGSVPLLGGGALSGTDATKILNGNLPQLTNLNLNNGAVPSVGSLGADPNSMLKLDTLRQAVSQLLPAGNPRTQQANSILDQLTQQVATLPVNAPIKLDQLPVGVELNGLLADLQKFASNDISLPVTVNFDISAPAAASAHTITSLIWPEGAKGFPIDQPGAFVGKTSMQLTEPGLYAFACKVHPYMLGAIVVDDPLTPGLDFGKKLRVNSRGLSVPSDSHIIAELVQKFFNITAPANWQKFSNTAPTTWNPTYPPAPILMYDADGKPELVPSLDAYLKNTFGLPKTLPALTERPSTPGVGEVWVDTEMEQTASKTKSGTATKINASNWNIDRKVALPQVNMNNPHNMWTDRDEKYIYQTEWFSDKLDVFNRQTGAFVRQIQVGPDPSHVMTRTDTDQLHVALNGGSAVMELSPGATKIDRRIPVQGPGEKIAHPHAHWMSADGQTMVTPNVNTYDSTIVDVPSGTIKKEQTGELPIATGMMPDSSKAYEANFLGATVSCISLKANACHDGGALVHHKEIDLWSNYDPVKGPNGSFGGLPIQIPVSPDGQLVLVANTLTSNITVIDTKTDQVVKYLPCDSGCHGINFGAKKGGGYYAYVSSKFSNAMEIIDPDPNGTGDPADAKVVGKLVLDPGSNTATDDQIVNYAGYGGMGVLTVPIAYNGWVQHAPSNAINDQLTCRQRNPITFSTNCK